MQKLDRNLGLNRSTRLNGVIGLHDILIDEMKNREGKGGEEGKMFFFLYIYDFAYSAYFA